MSRVSPAPVHVLVDDTWIRGTVRTCEVTPDGTTCSAVVSYGTSTCVTTTRVEAARMRRPTGEPGCPAAHQDASCGAAAQPQQVDTAAHDLTRAAAGMLATRGVPVETVLVADQDGRARAVAERPTVDGWRLEASHTPLFLTATGLLHLLHADGPTPAGSTPTPGQHISSVPMAFHPGRDGEPEFRVLAPAGEDTYGLEGWLVREVARLVRLFSTRSR